jgi:hypothetical protein
MKASTLASKLTVLKSKSDRTIVALDRFSHLNLFFQQIWQFLLRIAASNSEIRVWRTGDRQGKIIWHVYDAAIDQIAHFESEAEVRSWLEARYYR